MWSTDNIMGRLLIRHFRKLEERGYSEAAAIIVLTHEAKSIVEANPAYRGAKISVIPTSVDQNLFTVDSAIRTAKRAELGLAHDTPVIAYLGSSSALYRMDLLYRLYDAVRAQEPNVRLMFVGDHDAQQHAKNAAKMNISMDPKHMICRRVPHEDVPTLLNSADLGVSFIIGSPSSLGVSATKVGEYLACGLPVASNTGIGDIERIIIDGENGIIIQNESDQEIKRCAQQFLSGFSANRLRVKAKSEKYFSMEAAVETYDTIYRSLVK